MKIAGIDLEFLKLNKNISKDNDNNNENPLIIILWNLIRKIFSVSNKGLGTILDNKGIPKNNTSFKTAPIK